MLQVVVPGRSTLLVLVEAMCVVVVVVDLPGLLRPHPRELPHGTTAAPIFKWGGDAVVVIISGARRRSRLEGLLMVDVNSGSASILFMLPLSHRRSWHWFGLLPVLLLLVWETKVIPVPRSYRVRVSDQPIRVGPGLGVTQAGQGHLCRGTLATHSCLVGPGVGPNWS